MIKHHELEVAWHVKDHDQRVLPLVIKKDPDLERVVAELQVRCPVAETCRPFEDATYHRLKGHVRSFAARTSAGGVVVVKGTEPLTKDYLEVFEEARGARPFLMLSKVDWYLLIENEPFLGQSLNIALHYATLSLEFTTKYVERFGVLPRIPFPIAVYKLPQAAAEAFRDRCQSFATDRPQMSARARLGELIQKGLGVFAYYYPGTPLRAAHARGFFPGSHDAGSFADDRRFDFKTAIEGWLELTAEMLVLGYFPTAHIHQGNCLQAQNLVIDGGMCDVDSLEPMRNVIGDRMFLDAMFYSLLQLTGSIASVLTDKTVHVPQVVFSMVWAELSARVRRKANEQTDPRLLDLLQPMNLDVLLDPRMMSALREMRSAPIGVI